MKVFAILNCLILCSFNALSQPVSGRVIDAESGDPLPFATVAVVNHNWGTISNAEGYFALDGNNLGSEDFLQVSYVGYESVRISVSQLGTTKEVRLTPAILNLSAVEIRDRELTAKEILKRVEVNFEQNHPKRDLQQRLFYHRYEKTPWPETNKLEVKESDFVGLDKSLIQELFSQLPKEFVEYQDVVLDMYNVGEEVKVIPVQAISLEESSMEELSTMMEEKLSAFFEDFEASQQDEDVYYKFRTGIFAGKMESGEKQDSIRQEQLKDSLNYLIHSTYVRRSIMSLLENYADIESDNWEFVNKPGRYRYDKPELTVMGDELVYRLVFRPDGRGHFRGNIYVSAASFAVLQLEFEFAQGVQTEKFDIMGIQHALNFKKGRVIFERTGDAYFPKYIYAEKQEEAAIERSFSIMKKQKRFFVDKELNEIKISANLSFNMESYWELLIMNRQELDQDAFASIKEPAAIRFKKEYAYSPEMWTSGTVIQPTSELQTYKRAEK